MRKNSSKNEPVKPTKQPQAQKKAVFDLKQYVRPGVSEDYIYELKKAFDLFDSDQSGTIDMKELKATMTGLGFQSKSTMIYQMISDLDTDGSGTIDFQQWVTLLTKRTTVQDPREDFNRIFRLFDLEKTGYISVQNLRTIANEIQEDIGQQQLNELIRRADTDGDGLVSQEQFYRFLIKSTCPNGL